MKRTRGILVTRGVEEVRSSQYGVWRTARDLIKNIYWVPEEEYRMVR